jgi:hypothetical protein
MIPNYRARLLPVGDPLPMPRETNMGTHAHAPAACAHVGMPTWLVLLPC